MKNHLPIFQLLPRRLISSKTTFHPEAIHKAYFIREYAPTKSRIEYIAPVELKASVAAFARGGLGSGKNMTWRQQEIVDLDGGRYDT